MGLWGLGWGLWGAERSCVHVCGVMGGCGVSECCYGAVGQVSVAVGLWGLWDE